MNSFGGKRRGLFDTAQHSTLRQPARKKGLQLWTLKSNTQIPSATSETAALLAGTRSIPGWSQPLSLCISPPRTQLWGCHTGKPSGGPLRYCHPNQQLRDQQETVHPTPNQTEMSCNTACIQQRIYLGQGPAETCLRGRGSPLQRYANSASVHVSRGKKKRWLFSIAHWSY